MQTERYNDDEVTDGLLARWLAGEASDADDATIRQWMAAAPDNRKRAEEYRAIWLQSKSFAAGERPADADEAWVRFQQRTAAQPTARRARLMPARKTVLAVAAGLAMLLGLGSLGWYWLEVRPNEMIAVHAWDQPETALLADGSRVTLNKGATLWHPRAFRNADRRVTLSGEAFFEVAPDQVHPFIITAGSADIRVVGTSFNVKNRAQSTEVIVETGLVSVLSRRDSVLLHPQEQALLAANGTLNKTATTDQLHNYYRTREFICKGTPLKRLVAALNDYYDAGITIEDAQLAETPITATFKNESLDQMLDVITETLGVRVYKAGQQQLIIRR